MSDFEREKLLESGTRDFNGLGKASYFALFSALWASISAFQFGWHLGVINTPKDTIINTSFDMNDLVWGLFAGILCIGGLLGAFLGGFMSHKIGRKLTLVYKNLFFIFGGLLQSFSASIPMLIIGRFICGIGCGTAAAISPMYVAEISTDSSRGSFGCINQLMITFAILLSQVCGIAFNYSPGWRILFGLTAMPALIQIMLAFLVPESPRFLVSKGKVERARKSLLFLRQKNENYSVDAELLRLKETSSRREEKFRLSELIKNKTSRKALLLSTVTFFSQQFSAINGVIMFSTSIFEKFIGTGVEQANLLTVGIGSVNLVVTILSIYLVDRLGRRSLLMFSQYSVATASFLIVIGSLVSNDIFIAVSVMVFVSSFAIGLGPIPWLLFPELFPTYAISTASPVCTSVSWISNFIIGFNFLNIQSSLGPYTFLPFGLISLSSAIFTTFNLPESKGKSFDEIESLLSQ